MQEFFKVLYMPVAVVLKLNNKQFNQVLFKSLYQLNKSFIETIDSCKFKKVVLKKSGYFLSKRMITF